MALRDILLNGILRAGTVGAKIHKSLVSDLDKDNFDTATQRRLPPDPASLPSGNILQVGSEAEGSRTWTHGTRPTGGGAAISSSNPEPVDNAPAAGSANTASAADHKHRLNIANTGDIDASWDEETVRLNLENTRLRDWGADLTGEGYRLVDGAITQTTWTTEPTLAQLAAADTGNYYEGVSRLTDVWVGISIDSTMPLTDTAELRVGASDDGSILFVKEQTNILRVKFPHFTSKGSTGGRSYFTYRVPDIPLGDYVTVVRHEPLTINTSTTRFDPPFAHESHLPELVTSLPFEPSVGTTRRITGAVSYPVTVEGTVTATANTGELLLQFTDQVVNGLTLAQINIYGSDYQDHLSSLRNGKVFAQFVETNNAVANASVYIDGTAHAITATYLDQQQSSKEHEVPTLDPANFAAGQTVRIQFIRGSDQSPASKSIGHAGQTVTVVYAGNDQWNWSGSAPLDAQGRIQFSFLGVRLTQAEYTALTIKDPNSVYYIQG